MKNNWLNLIYKFEDMIMLNIFGKCLSIYLGLFIYLL